MGHNHFLVINLIFTHAHESLYVCHHGGFHGVVTEGIGEDLVSVELRVLDSPKALEFSLVVDLSKILSSLTIGFLFFDDLETIEEAFSFFFGEHSHSLCLLLLLLLNQSILLFLCSFDGRCFSPKSLSFLIGFPAALIPIVIHELHLLPVLDHPLLVLLLGQQ